MEQSENQFDLDNYVAALHSDESSEDDKMDAMDLIAEFMKSLDGLVYVITNFQNFRNELTYTFIFKLLRYWIAEKSNEIQNEVLESMKVILFQQGNEISNRFGDDFGNELILTQVEFIFYAFPMKWPDFWDYIMKFEQSYVFKFLNGFCYQCSVMTPRKFAMFSNFKNALIAAKVIQQVYSMAFANLMPVSYSIISSMSKWTDISWVTDGGLFSAFMSNIGNPECSKYIFKTFSSIITRNLDDSIKLSLISSVGNPERVQQICQESNSVDVYVEAANYIYSAGIILLASENSVPYYELALIFLQLDSVISIIVAPFLASYTKQYPETAQNTLPVAIARLVTLFNDIDESGFPSLTQKPYIESLCNIISACFIVDSENTSQIITQIFTETFDIEGAPQFSSAILYILNYMNDKTSASTNFVEEFIPHITPLAQLEYPLPFTHVFAVYLLFRLFVHRNDKFPLETRQDIFTSLINFIVSQELPECHLNGCIEILNQLARNQKTNFTISAEVLTMFINTLNESLVGAAGALMRYVAPADASAVIGAAIPQLAELMMSEETSQRGVSCILSLGSKVPNSVILPEMQDFLIKAVQTCEIPSMDSDHTVSLFIKALSERLQATASADIFRLNNALCGPQSITAFVNHMILYRQTIRPEDFMTIINSLFDVFSFQIELFTLELDTLNSADSYAVCIRQFFKLMTDSAEMLTEGMTNYLFDLAETCLNKFYAQNVIFDSTIQLLSGLSKQNMDQVIRRFYAMSFNFIFATAFDPNNPNGMKIAQRVSAFHRELHVIQPDICMEILLQVLSHFGLGVDDANIYIGMHELDARVKNEELRRFVQNLVTLKKSIEF